MSKPYNGDISFTEILKPRHCGSCFHSEATGDINKPLICHNKSGKDKFGDKAGDDHCASECGAYVQSDNVSMIDKKEKITLS